MDYNSNDEEIIDLNINDYKSNFVYPKGDILNEINLTESTQIHKKSSKFHSKYKENPMITHFNQNSFFVYDLNEVYDYLHKIKNKNNLKLNDSEVQLLQNKILQLEKEKEIDKGNSIIYIDINLANDLDSFKKDKYESKDQLKLFLLNEFNKSQNRSQLSVRKLAKKYEAETGNKTSKSTIHNCLRKKLGYKYLSTTVKNNLLLHNDYLLMTFAFIKIVIRCLKYDFSIIYCDESFLQTKNNNMKKWRKSYEDIYDGTSKKEKINLILSTNENGILYYELNNENTKEQTFLSYLKNLMKIIKEKNITNYAIILDNYSVHKTESLYKFYFENNVNIIFNVPYLSKFNSVELGFRNLKKKLYSKYYKNIEEIKEEAAKILESDNFQKGIKGNFKTTLQQYLRFYEKQKYTNINSLIK